MGTLLGNALARAGVVSQEEADRAERALQMRKAAEKASQPPPRQEDQEQEKKG